MKHEIELRKGLWINDVKILGFYPSNRYGSRYRVQCVCGEEVVKTRAQLIRGGASVLCAVCKREAAKDNPAFKRRKTHGESRTYLYVAYNNMKSRCKGNHTSQNWRERGITVCPEWENDYPAFADYVRSNIGERPSPSHSLDRIDNDRGYEPGNIRWATPAEQSNNQMPRWKWKRRVMSTPAIDDPVWAERVGNLPETMHHNALAAHLGISAWKLRGILSLLGKKCVRKNRTLSDPLI